MEKILLFSLLKYCIQLDKANVDSDFKDFIRVVRNLLIRVRWRDKTKYESNLRYEFIPKQIDDICNILITPNNIYEFLDTDFVLSGFYNDEFEKIKAQLIIENSLNKASIHELEDNSRLKGLIHNFDIEKNITHLSLFNKTIEEIWSENSDSEIISALLSIDDFSKHIGYSALGSRYFFGNKNKWHTILTDTSEESVKLKTILPTFLLAYSKSEELTSKLKLQSLQKEYLVNNSKKDWRYYFIKYPEMTSTNNNLFTWKDDVFDFEIRNLGGNSLLAYHINPYVRTVAKLINNENICAIHNCYSQYANESPLILKNEVELHCKEDGWQIIIPDFLKLPSELINHFNLESIEEGKKYCLKENDNQDRIEIAVEFSIKLFSQNRRFN
ncbi:MAG: hypothetical protein HY738_13380 [Bacteroidia bacterium]|nr:hypothetical protein [Bacteroidia bacterium]